MPCSCILRNSFLPAKDFLVWQFFYLQNTTALGDVSPSQIAEIIGKEVADVNQSISNLTENGLLQYRTIELNGEIELIFDASLAFERLDSLLDSQTPATTVPNPQNQLKDLVETFQQEFGTLINTI